MFLISDYILFIISLFGTPSDRFAQIHTEQVDENCDLELFNPLKLGTRCSSKITIAVINTRINLDLPDLADCLWINSDEIPSNCIDDDVNGKINDSIVYDFKNSDNDQLDSLIDNHGIIVVKFTDKVLNTTIMVLKSFDNSGITDPDEVTKVVRYAMEIVKLTRTRLLSSNTSPSQHSTANLSSITYMLPLLVGIVLRFALRRCRR